MPVETKPEDKPARVCFHRNGNKGELEVTCSMVTSQATAPYRIGGGAARGGVPERAGERDADDSMGR
jgi:hypothetical protein